MIVMQINNRGVLGFWGFGVLGFWGAGTASSHASRATSSVAVPARFEVRDDRPPVVRTHDAARDEVIDRRAQVNERLTHGAVRRRGLMEERHLVVLKIVVAAEALVHASEPTQAEVGHLARPDGAHRGEAPCAPAGGNRIADLGVSDGERVVEHSVDDHEHSGVSSRLLLRLHEDVDIVPPDRAAQPVSLREGSRSDRERRSSEDEDVVGGLLSCSCRHSPSVGSRGCGWCRCRTRYAERSRA